MGEMAAPSLQRKPAWFSTEPRVTSHKVRIRGGGELPQPGQKNPGAGRARRTKPTKCRAPRPAPRPPPAARPAAAPAPLACKPAPPVELSLGPRRQRWDAGKPPDHPEATGAADLTRRERRGRPTGPSPRSPSLPAPAPRRWRRWWRTGPITQCRLRGTRRGPPLPALRARRPEGHRSLPETLGRTPPPPAVRCRRPLSPGLPARRRGPPAAPAAPLHSQAQLARRHRRQLPPPPLLPLLLLRLLGCGEQNKQPCRRRRRRRRRRRQRTDVTAHVARAITCCRRRPACALCPGSGASKLRRGNSGGGESAGIRRAGFESIEICEYLLAPDFAHSAICGR
ncbi:uncharacterized protein LOC106145120 [Ictidomys tridecemlineatus]